jgi:hypothetical protein
MEPKYEIGDLIQIREQNRIDGVNGLYLVLDFYRPELMGSLYKLMNVKSASIIDFRETTVNTYFHKVA